MNKQYGYNYFLKKQKKVIIKKLSIFNGLLLIVQMSLGSMFFITLPLTSIQASTDQLCSAAADIVLVMDRSGSMGYTSKCDWWEFKCVDTPVCTSYAWQQHTDYDKDQTWCIAKNQSDPYNSVWTEYNPTKISAAKQAANDFLGLMGAGDQSALVSFANDASLDKQLSSNHLDTVTAVNNLSPVGATNIGSAISLGTDELKSTRANSQAARVMILLTDGKANKPNGPGNGENAADVAYAQDKAIEAANYGFKIFTIGLGNNGEINETMLQNIADATGAQYYNAPTQNDLQAIYNLIAIRLCEYGSISGCKYSDINNDGIITDHTKLSGWEIKLNNNDSLSQLTDADGCYQFSGLAAGTYTVSEGGKGSTEYIQTYPSSKTYSIDLAEGEQATNKDFGNYLPICGNQLVDTDFGEVCDNGSANGSCPATCSIACQANQCGGGGGQTGTISGYKYNDTNNNGVVDSGEQKLGGWAMQLIGCPYAPLGTSTIQFLPNSNWNTISTSTATTTTGQCSIIATTTTNGTGYYEFTGLNEGDYGVSELITASGWAQTYPANDTFYYFNLPANTNKTDIDFANYKPGEVANPYCGDGAVNQESEQCDGGTSNGACPATCSNTCQSNQCSSGGGGGGGGGGTPPFLLGNTASGYSLSTPQPIVKGEEGAPSFKITKTITTKLEFANPGQKDIEYSIIVTNEGNLTAYGVTLKDALPSGLRYADSSASPRAWDLGDIEAGKNKAVTYKVNVNEDAKPMLYRNTAEATATNISEAVQASADLNVKTTRVLAATGFDVSEFAGLVFVFLSLSGLNIFLRRQPVLNKD